jgi:hypothetical protein
VQEKSAFERASKLTVLLSLVGAGILFAWLAGRDQPAKALLVGAVVIGWWAGRRGFSDLILSFGYFVPLTFRLLTNTYYEPYHMVF